MLRVSSYNIRTSRSLEYIAWLATRSISVKESLSLFSLTWLFPLLYLIQREVGLLVQAFLMASCNCSSTILKNAWPVWNCLFVSLSLTQFVQELAWKIFFMLIKSFSLDYLREGFPYCQITQDISVFESQ